MSSLSAKSEGRVGWPGRKIEIDDSGFVVVEGSDPPKVCCRWATILEVFAYKIDLFSYDEICIGFRFNAAGDHWWVGESYTGYQELLAELPRRFPGIRTDWFSEVAHPAFVTNRTSLWGEALASSDPADDSDHARPWWRKLWA